MKENIQQTLDTAFISGENFSVDFLRMYTHTVKTIVNLRCYISYISGLLVCKTLKPSIFRFLRVCRVKCPTRGFNFWSSNLLGCSSRSSQKYIEDNFVHAINLDPLIIYDHQRS